MLAIKPLIVATARAEQIVRYRLATKIKISNQAKAVFATTITTVTMEAPPSLITPATAILPPTQVEEMIVATAMATTEVAIAVATTEALPVGVALDIKSSRKF
jgi:hypothetical protein